MAFGSMEIHTYSAASLSILALWVDRSEYGETMELKGWSHKMNSFWNPKMLMPMKNVILAV